jgi:hypothetical protein
VSNLEASVTPLVRSYLYVRSYPIYLIGIPKPPSTIVYVLSTQYFFGPESERTAAPYLLSPVVNFAAQDFSDIVFGMLSC